jgi:two-component system, NarL family, nitrate/nitrite response regulator NarL
VVGGCQLAGQTLQAALAAYGFNVAVSAASSEADTLYEVRAQRPGVVVLDLDRAGPGFGRGLIVPLVDLGVTVLVLIGTADRLEAAHCLEAGAAGVASNAESFATLLEKFRCVVGGEPVTPLGDRLRSQRELDDHRRADRRRLAPFESLTPRERDILALIVEGRPAAEIARRDRVALPTVRTQVRSILQKLEVNSQMAAAALARDAGWSAPDRDAAAQSPTRQHLEAANPF